MVLHMRDVYSRTPDSIVNGNDYDILKVKMTQGNWYVNPKGDSQYQHAKQAGKLLGFYHYAEGGDPVTEADYYYKNCKNYFGEGVPALDWEEQDNSAWGDTTWALRFMQRVHELSGVWPLVYVQAFSLAQVASCAPYCGLWLAGYPSKTTSWPEGTPSVPYSISPWTAVTAWQFTSGTNAAPQDMNIVYTDVAGWKRIAKPSGAATSTPAPAPAPTPAAKPTPKTYHDGDYTITAENGTFYPDRTLSVWKYPGIGATGAQYHAGESVKYYGYVRNGNYLYVAYYIDGGYTHYVACRDYTNGNEALGTFR